MKAIKTCSNPQQISGLSRYETRLAGCRVGNYMVAFHRINSAMRLGGHAGTSANQNWVHLADGLRALGLCMGRTAATKRRLMSAFVPNTLGSDLRNSVTRTRQ